MLLVDSNVILDVVQDHPQWRKWSQEQLEAAAGHYALLVNPMIYAEPSIAYLDTEADTHHARRLSYQRNNRGPTIAPAAAGISIPSGYQMPRNGALNSGQCSE